MPVLHECLVVPWLAGERRMVSYHRLKRSLLLTHYAVDKHEHCLDRLPVDIARGRVTVHGSLGEARKARLVKDDKPRHRAGFAHEMAVECQVGDDVVANVVGARPHRLEMHAAARSPNSYV